MRRAAGSYRAHVGPYKSGAMFRQGVPGLFGGLLTTNRFLRRMLQSRHQSNPGKPGQLTPVEPSRRNTSFLDNTRSNFWYHVKWDTDELKLQTLPRYFENYS